MCAPCEDVPVLANAAPREPRGPLGGTFLRREADAQMFQEYCDGLGDGSADAHRPLFGLNICR